MFSALPSFHKTYKSDPIVSKFMAYAPPFNWLVVPNIYNPYEGDHEGTTVKSLQDEVEKLCSSLPPSPS